MSKDEKQKQTNELMDILMEGYGDGERSCTKEELCAHLAICVRNAGFRDITDLKKWLKGERKKWGNLWIWHDDEQALGRSYEISNILKKLESL
jgi:hypothetical protein